MAFSSKYVVSLYENISQRQDLDFKTHDDFTLDDFREKIGIKQGKYPAFGALNKCVLKPAVDEINALAPFNISLLPVRTGKKVSHIRIGLWKKTEDELKEAWAESKRSRVGRKACTSGRVEHVKPMPSVSSMTKRARLMSKSTSSSVLKRSELLSKIDLESANYYLSLKGEELLWLPQVKLSL